MNYQALLKKLTVTQLVKNFPAFYGTPKFITVFTTVHQMHPVHNFPPYFPKIYSNITIPLYA
jgi:hypothetical protein